MTRYEVYDLGYYAGNIGQSFYSNPYSCDAWEYWVWNEGWNAGNAGRSIE